MQNSTLHLLKNVNFNYLLNFFCADKHKQKKKTLKNLRIKSAIKGL